MRFTVYTIVSRRLINVTAFGGIERMTERERKRERGREREERES